jgi:ribonuclease P protein component
LQPIFALSGGCGKGHETHIPAQQNQARPHARFSRTHGNEGRAPRLEAPSRERPRTPDAIVRTAINRFGKDQRLLNAADFGRVFAQATRSRDKLFTVLCRRNATDTARLGLAISRKQCRRAAARNRIKRLIRESFRQHQDQLSGLDIVVINQAGASLASNPQLFDSLDRHWQRCARVKSEGPKTNG